MKWSTIRFSRTSKHMCGILSDHTKKIKNIRIKRSIILFSALFTLWGCRKDLLDTKPYGAVSSETMWTTENLTDKGMTGIYQALRLNISTSGASGNELYQLDRFAFTGQERDLNALLSGTITASNGLFSSNWQQFYEGIQRANIGIKNIAEVSPVAAEKKGRLMAECKFMRAYFYFRLNQVFKGVPLYLEPITDASAASKPRETEATIWEAIITDLTDAINEPNLPAKYTASDPAYGRVTKGAAYALRGKVWLYRKEWALAAADFSKVKDAGFKLFTGSYADLFKLANERSDETIFSIQNINQTGGWGATTQFFCGSRSSFGSCWNTYLPSPNLVDLYENIDGTAFNWDAIIPGYNSMPAAKREVFFFRDGLTPAEITAAAARGLDMSLYLPAGNEARIKAAWENRDPRLKATVITPYATYLGRPINGSDQTFTSRWPARNENPPVLDLFTDTRNLFYYLYRKFVYEGSTQLIDRISGPTDIPIMRYADVALMWAEAINEQGFSQEAIDLVNSVRQRAGLPGLNTSPATTVSNQSELRERIRNERRVEFVLEGINYFDELRWGTWKEKVFATGNGVKQVWGANVSSYSYQGDHLGTWAIPASEVQMTGLQQNTGWIN